MKVVEAVCSLEVPTQLWAEKQTSVNVVSHKILLFSYILISQRQQITAVLFEVKMQI